MDRGIWNPNNNTLLLETTSLPNTPTCPRCGSINTKFCYYNNYSLTQPRFFCKSCRRYWTKGGSLRNVPVGGGCRRKTTRSSSSSSRSLPNININPAPSSSSLSSVHHPMIRVTDINTSSTGGSLPPPVSAADTDDDGGVGRPNIDLALVYANFLNRELPNVMGSSSSSSPVLPPLQFSGVGDLENEHVTEDGNIIPFCNYNFGGGGVNGKQEMTLLPSATTSVDHHEMDNNEYPLLLLPPPYLGGGEQMVWPSSDDLISCPGDDSVINTANNYIDESTARILPRVQDSNQVDDQDGSLLSIPNYGIFQGLDGK